MSNIVDRRGNSKNEGINIRQKFIKRAHGSIKKAIREAIDQNSITDINTNKNGNKISIPIKDISEPSFKNGNDGNQDYVLPGNKDFAVGDRIKKPQNGQGEGNGEGEASDSGEGEDSFTFTLTREEFLDFFFDDLELPDLIKTQLKQVDAFKTERAGYTVSGSPNNLDLVRTMKNSIGRKIALKTPILSEIEKLINNCKLIEKSHDYEDVIQYNIWQDEIESLTKKLNSIPYIDEFDVRYRAYDKKPKPNTQAVMFCIMDVSASMGEYEKGLAKRFFMLLHMFLFKKYKKIDIVFIRHHTTAKECNEQEFFYDKESGGTLVSSALDLTHKIITERYNLSSWNIYIAQASDGDNFSSDTEKVRKILDEKIMPMVQYYSYIQISHDVEMGNYGFGYSDKSLWTDFEPLMKQWNNFKMSKINTPNQIFPVFRDLFKKKGI